MVKIKVKKEMELPELLRWASDNDIKGCKINGDQGSNVLFNKNGWVSMHYYVSLEENFEVEVEKELTEDTEVPKLIEVYEYDGMLRIYLSIKMTIKKVLNDSQNNPLHILKALYMLNDDYTMTLIWRNGEMIE